jgi:FtsH-binding integral membrane protein
MATPTSTVDNRSPQTTNRHFRAVKWLVGAYLILSMLTVAAIITFSDIAPTLVTPQAWVRGIIVAATSILTFVFARRAARGNPRALLRLRIVVAVILIAIVAVLLFLPLPLWMFIEQVACGALLLATAVIIFRPTARSELRSSSTWS